MTADWLRGAWMQTFTGRQFFPLRPEVEDIDPVDIAHALSLTCRYGGHTTRFYSVAEHCVLMSMVVPPEDALAALLHDAAEAYVGDMVRPLKLEMPEFRVVEDRLLKVIGERFDVVLDPLPVSVKEADNRILLNERAELLSAPPAPWAVEHLEPLPLRITGWAPQSAELTYMDRLADLTGGAS